MVDSARQGRETDCQLRSRLAAMLPQGAWYSAEDLGNATGEQLDALAEAAGTKRQDSSDGR